MKKLPKQKIVFIEWIDASMWGTSQMSEAEASDCGLSHGFVCGFLIKEDKEKVIVAIDWFVDNPFHYRNICTYPKTGIKKLIVKDFPIKQK